MCLTILHACCLVVIAPSFTATVSMGSLQGKFVVLEWVNPIKIATNYVPQALGKAVSQAVTQP